MRTDLRVKHDAETRRLAAELFADGLGRAAAAKRLSVPEAAVRKWQQIYRAFGSEVLLTMDGKQARYTYEQKVAAARTVVEDGVARPAAMAALRSNGHDLGRLLACSGLARSTYYYALAHPKRPTRPELREAAAEIFSRTANGCGHRQMAMRLRAELGARVADKTVLKMMREMGIRCGIRRETDYHKYNSYKGVVGETFENVIGRDFSAAAPWQKMGTDVTEFKQPWGKAYFAPVYDFGSKEIVGWATSTSPNMEQQELLLDRLLERMPKGAKPVLHSDSKNVTSRALAEWARANDARLSCSRTGNCRDNAVAESFFATPKNEMYYRSSFATRADAKHAVIEFIEVDYNRRRPHSTIGYQVPAQAMDSFFERTKQAEEGLPMAA